MNGLKGSLCGAQFPKRVSGKSNNNEQVNPLFIRSEVLFKDYAIVFE